MDPAFLPLWGWQLGCLIHVLEEEGAKQTSSTQTWAQDTHTSLPLDLLSLISAVDEKNN